MRRPLAPEPAPAPKRRGRKPQVDIDLGPEPVAEIDLAPEPEEPLVGPGGTFGMYPPQQAPAPAAEFETPILLEDEPAPTAEEFAAGLAGKRPPPANWTTWCRRPWEPCPPTR